VFFLVSSEIPRCFFWYRDAFYLESGHLAFNWVRFYMGYVPPNDNGEFEPRKEVKLLVVDDQAEHFAHLQEAAEIYHVDYAIECRMASSRDEALEMAANWHPTVVLIDLHVVSDALNLLSQIAEIGPAVVATSESRIPDIPEKVAQYGAVGYVTKSDTAEDIESVLHYIASVAAPMPTSH
jgi:DNA-binding NarL/FixJ family response regulator